MKTRKFLIILISTLIFVFSSCSFNTNSNRAIDNTNVVEFEGAKTADIDIRMGAGKLSVQGGAEKLMNANFIYSISEWKPEVKYSVTNGEGELEVSQPSSFKISSLGNNEYNWDILLSNNIPMDLNVDLGAGESKLNLSTLNLTDLEVTLGAGEVTLDLSGEYKQGFNAEITGGVGKTTIYLPKDIGVKVNLRRGIGKLNADGFIIKGDSYVNESYGKSKITLDIEMKAGIGEVNLILK